MSEAGDQRWNTLEHVRGKDEFWDRLGGWEWAATDDLMPGARVYIKWGERSDGHLVVTDLCIRGSVDEPLTSRSLRSLPVARLEAAANAAKARVAELALQQEPPLGRPDGSDPDAFYRRVADHYHWHASGSSRPVADMAEAAKVPVTTVHRWVREARRRGFLPPGSRGKAG
jgi:hypothetical protein